MKRKKEKKAIAVAVVVASNWKKTTAKELEK